MSDERDVRVQELLRHLMCTQCYQYRLISDQLFETT